METFDAIILGAGAAGLMCAMRAAERGRKVLLLEHGVEAGAKILISGGGRCNFTNREVRADRFLSNNPHFCKSALASYTAQDFILLVEKHKIAYHEKTLGQLFCDLSARQITTMLLDECTAKGVDLRLSHHVRDVQKSDQFTVTTDHGAFQAPKIVLATGGLSIPKLGATGFAHRIATQFGLPVTPVAPALVPLKVEGAALQFMQPLSGVSLEVVARSGKASFREDMIFTHRGLSGPAVLQISSYLRGGEKILFDLLPGTDAHGFLIERKGTRGKAELKTVLSEVLPQRLAQKLTETAFENQVMGQLSDKRLGEIAGLLKAWPVIPSDTEGYVKAEVTLGGIDTRSLSSKTMEAEKVPGLFAIGEAVDVTGWLGGYNFQWAWSSGWSAGSAL